MTLLVQSLLLGVLAVGHVDLARATGVPLPPSIDPFYQPPHDYTARHLGEILRWRAIAYADSIAAPADAVQLLYRSQDSQSLPSAGITTVFIPKNSTRPIDKIVSLQTAYDSTAVDFTPSYFLTSDPSQLGETIRLASYLAQGWAVSIPDFEGFFPAFSNGIQAGYSTLDSIRAVLSSGDITGLDSAARVALVGGSGGTVGSEFALEILDDYAPELSSQVVGALLLALVPDANSTVHANDGIATAGLIPLILQGLAKQDSVFADWLSGVVLPDQADRFFAALRQSGAEFAISFAFQKSDSYLLSSDVFQQDVPQETFKRLATMGLRGTPTTPLFICNGVKDTLSPIEDTDSLIHKYCSDGADIIYQRATNAEHGSSGAYGAVAGFPWLADRLNGKSPGQGCGISDVSVSDSFIATLP